MKSQREIILFSVYVFELQIMEVAREPQKQCNKA